MDNHIDKKRHHFALVQRAGCWTVLAVVGVLVHGSNSMADESSSVPAWMSGVSTWTGDGYSTPVPATDAPPITGTSSHGQRLNPYVSSSDVPYTVPINPQTASKAVSNSINFVAPTFDSVPSSTNVANPVAQVAHQAGNSNVALNNSFPSSTTGSGPLSQGIGQGLGQGIGMERPPLMTETLSWYQYPWRWMSEGWTNSFELGLDGSQGNAETLAIQTGAELKRKTDAYTLALDFDYRLANNRKVVTEENGRLNIDYDRLLGDSPWSIFGKFGMEWDEFKAFDLRLNLNSGLGYHWIRDDQTTFVTRFGAGASREIGSPDDDWVPEAVFGMDLEHQVNKRNKLKAKVDYFPSWEDFSNYRVVSDASWEILLSEDDSLSLKLAATDRYDSTPQGGNKANDVYYSLLLLVKF
ncbi:MAG: DUF481 domain-containing protein [Pirellulaceae bacterium]